MLLALFSKQYRDLAHPPGIPTASAMRPLAPFEYNLDLDVQPVVNTIGNFGCFKIDSRPPDTMRNIRRHERPPILLLAPKGSGMSDRRHSTTWITGIDWPSARRSELPKKRTRANCKVEVRIAKWVSRRIHQAGRMA